MLYNPPSGATEPNAPFDGKNVAAGKQGSKVPRMAVEGPQREIVAAIVAAGLSPTNSDLTQLAQAIRILIARATATTVPIDYYVNAASGSDLNDGLSAGTALATIQRAVDLGSRIRTVSGAAINIRVADGTYAPFMASVRDTVLNLIGNTATPGNCIISAANPGAPCAALAGTRATLQGFRLIGNGPGVKAYEQANVKLGAVEFGVTGGGTASTSSFSLYALDSSIIRAVGALRQLAVMMGSFMVSGAGCTIDLSNQSVVLDAFTALQATGQIGMTAWANGGFINVAGTAFSGAGPASAKRFQSDSGGGSVFTNGQGANFIPGTVAGTGSYN